MRNGFRQVAVIAKSLPHYRRRFFELLRDRLAADGVELVVIHGEPDSEQASKQDSVSLPWARKGRSLNFRFLGHELIWQRDVLKHLTAVDLVVVEQASKLLLNYVLQLQYWLGGPRLAFWGHGRNFQSQAASLAGERVKRILSRRVHWWFAYNDLSATIVRELGFPSDRITSVQNAIDTRELSEAKAASNTHLCQQTRTELGILGHNVCIFAGSLYAEKRLDFLLDAARAIRSRVPDFELIVIGAGPDADRVRCASADAHWIKYIGPKFDREKVPYFAISKLFLLPGAVGLAVLDSFALEVPMVTTRATNHGPEIEYLKTERNGLIVPDGNDVDKYALAVATLLENEEQLERLRAGCRSARDIYTVESMVERFAQGVKRALA